MRIAYRLVAYDRRTERLIGSQEIRTDLVAQIRRIAGIPPSDDGCGDYPIDPKQTHRVAKKLGITVHPEMFDYFIEPNLKSPVFLTETGMQSEIRNLLQGPGPHRLAVAFWGGDALKRLGLAQASSPVQIVCNLTSGGTNPKAIHSILQSDRKHEVRTHPRLHAKIYLSRRSAILGSSNASANGLSLQDDELDGWREANVFLDDAEFVSNAHAWFERIWTDSAPIDDDLLKAANLAWRKARARDKRTSDRPKLSLLKAIQDGDPNLSILPIKFLVYERQNPSPRANDAIRRIRADPNDAVREEALAAEIDFWEEWRTAKPSTYYIDYDDDGKFWGIWKTPALNHVRDLPGGYSITVCYHVKDIEGYAISKPDQAKLGRCLSGLSRTTGRQEFSVSDVERRVHQAP